MSLTLTVNIMMIIIMELFSSKRFFFSKCVLQLPHVCIGSGIGTGPGVIQDRFSPTLGRHRTNPLFNGHMAFAQPSQFDLAINPFMKSNQVSQRGYNSHKHLMTKFRVSILLLFT